MPEEADNISENPSLAVTEDVKDLIQELITKYNFDSKAEVTYSAGSDVGDNYASKTIAADIKDDKETLSLFLKYAHNIVSMPLIPLDKIYANEIYFYDVIYPELIKFAEDRGVKDAFTNVPKCYGTSTKHVVALNNLKKIGYELADRKKIMNENHIIIVLEAFARYHALCFAFKDQRKARFEEISKKIFNVFGDAVQNNDAPAQNPQDGMIAAFLAQLDPIQDKHILDKCENLGERLRHNLIEAQTSRNDNVIITKGDCWSNNIMFRYEDAAKENPSDVMLIDWQIITQGSVVIDLSYFFYTCACDGELNKLDFYLDIYHQELSKYIRKLGSNPYVLYPYALLEKEWKKYCLFGYMMAIMIINAMLIDKEEAPDFGKHDEKDIMIQFAEMKTSPEYFRRMKNLTQHLIKNNFL